MTFYNLFSLPHSISQTSVASLASSIYPLPPGHVIIWNQLYPRGTGAFCDRQSDLTFTVAPGGNVGLGTSVCWAGGQEARTGRDLWETLWLRSPGSWQKAWSQRVAHGFSEIKLVTDTSRYLGHSWFMPRVPALLLTTLPSALKGWSVMFALVASRKVDSGQPWLRDWPLTKVDSGQPWLDLASTRDLDGIRREMCCSRKSKENDVRNPDDRSQLWPLVLGMNWDMYVEMSHKYWTFVQVTYPYMNETNEHIFYIHWASPHPQLPLCVPVPQCTFSSPSPPSRGNLVNYNLRPQLYPFVKQ